MFSGGFIQCCSWESNFTMDWKLTSETWSLVLLMFYDHFFLELLMGQKSGMKHWSN